VSAAYCGITPAKRNSNRAARIIIPPAGHDSLLPQDVLEFLQGGRLLKRGLDANCYSKTFRDGRGLLANTMVAIRPFNFIFADPRLCGPLWSANQTKMLLHIPAELPQAEPLIGAGHGPPIQFHPVSDEMRVLMSRIAMTGQQPMVETESLPE
jgi:hypothetical protein